MVDEVSLCADDLLGEEKSARTVSSYSFEARWSGRLAGVA
jgi:hypothetical protein